MLINSPGVSVGTENVAGHMCVQTQHLGASVTCCACGDPFSALIAALVEVGCSDFCPRLMEDGDPSLPTAWFLCSAARAAELSSKKKKKKKKDGE